MSPTGSTRPVMRFTLMPISIVAVLLTAACHNAGDVAAGWSGERVQRGDTLSVRSLTPVLGQRDSDLVTTDAATVWASDSLVRPRLIVRGPDSLLLIAERSQIFEVTNGGRLVTVVGAKGDGPGEFRAIQGIGFVAPDTLIVWDINLRRLSWLSLGGQFLKSVNVVPPERYSGARVAGLALWDNSILLAWNGAMVHAGDPPDSTILAATSSEGVTTRALATLPDIVWQQFAGIMATRSAYAADPHYAFGASAVAITDGLEPCVRVFVLHAGVHDVCRAWTRGRVTAAERSVAPLARVDASDRDRAMVTSIVEQQQMPELRSSIDRLAVGAGGIVWARMVDTTTKVHPVLAGWFAELRPARDRWSVFAGTGKWIGDVLVPSAFTPLLIERETLWGLATKEDGTNVIARVAVPREVVTAITATD